MFKKIAIGLGLVIVIVLGLATTKPDSFEIERVATIKAPPEKIMPLLSDFHNWTIWSPWEHLDPNMQRTFSGAVSGKGAVYAWKGNSDVGEGRMEIVEMVSPTRLVIKLDFLTPVESNNMTEFALVPQGEQTTVTWKMKGPMPFVSKIMTVFVSMETLIGPDLDRGIAKLKVSAEAPAVPAT